MRDNEVPAALRELINMYGEMGLMWVKNSPPPDGGSKIIFASQSLDEFIKKVENFCRDNERFPH